MRKAMKYITLIRRRKKDLSLFWEIIVLICKTLWTLRPWMLYAMFGWILPSGSEKEFLNFVSVFPLFLPAQWFWRKFLKIGKSISLFCYYRPLKKDTILHMNKFASPSKNALSQVCFKLSQKKIFFKLQHCIFAIL